MVVRKIEFFPLTLFCFHLFWVDIVGLGKTISLIWLIASGVLTWQLWLWLKIIHLILECSRELVHVVGLLTVDSVAHNEGFYFIFIFKYEYGWIFESDV